MAITINWGTKVITVPKADMTLKQIGPPEIRELNLDDFRLALKDLEDSEEGMPFPNTHRHNTEVVLSGITYARTIEIVNGYTVTFEDGQYVVVTVGANSNIADVKNPNQVSLVTNNSAGLQIVSTGSGLSAEEHNAVMEIPIVGDNVDLLIACIRNKRYLSKEGNTWYLSIRNATDTGDLLKKALKDKDAKEIADIGVGILAREEASIV